MSSQITDRSNFISKINDQCIIFFLDENYREMSDKWSSLSRLWRQTAIDLSVDKCRQRCHLCIKTTTSMTNTFTKSRTLMTTHTWHTRRRRKRIKVSPNAVIMCADSSASDRWSERRHRIGRAVGLSWSPVRPTCRRTSHFTPYLGTPDTCRPQWTGIHWNNGIIENKRQD